MTKRDTEGLFNCISGMAPSAGLRERVRTSAKIKINRLQINTQRFSRPAVAFVASISAIVVLAVALLSLAYNLDYGTVYMDINPSISLHINYFGIVHDAELINEDSKALLISSDEIIGCNIEKSIGLVLSKCADAGVLENAEVCISVYSERGSDMSEVTADVLEITEEAILAAGVTAGVSSMELNEEDVEAAEGTGISPGKLKIINKILESKPWLSLEELAEKTMSELKTISKIQLGNQVSESAGSESQNSNNLLSQSKDDTQDSDDATETAGDAESNENQNEYSEDNGDAGNSGNNGKSEEAHAGEYGRSENVKDGNNGNNMK